MRLHRTLLWLAATVTVSAAAQQTTIITVTSQVLHTDVQRFGINLSGQTYYDSGQMLANLVARNPGFEGEVWQTILRCKFVTATTCTDENPYTVWPANFIANAQYEILSGNAAGSTGRVLASSTANPPQGISVALTPPSRSLNAGDFILVRLKNPGSADAGSWTETTGGATLYTELHDLSPHTQGKQALRVEASGTQQTAKITFYFDTLADHSFVQLRSPYRLRFHAKSLLPNGRLQITLERLDAIHGRQSFLNQTVDLKPQWSDYVLNVPAHETGSSVGSVALTFTIHSAKMLLDDVSLTPAVSSPENPTAFRDEVVQTLRELHPGVLRYMDNGTSFGSSLDNLLAPAFARERSGFSLQQTKAEDVPIGLHDFLNLCAAVGADPWITLPPGLNQSEATHLIEYLAGTSKSAYGAKRVSMGRAQPWTQAFAHIHLELGNEQWNSGSFAGGTIADPSAYARRAAAIFTTMRAAPTFQHEKFDLVMGSWAAVPWWTQQELAVASNAADTVAVAPYLFSSFNDARSTEAVFGPMLAQPEQLDSRADGLMAQQAKAAADAHARLAVYETNLGTMLGTASQSDINAAVPSVGAGLAVADHMLLMLRDLGITTQNYFALPEFSNNFTNSNGAKETVPLWGAVVDMGGSTNRRRPSFLALQMINGAILPTELATEVEGLNPTWYQALSSNDKIALRGAHLLQAFAFAEGQKRSLILLNLSRTQALSVNLPRLKGEVQENVLTSAQITDSNEDKDLVEPRSVKFAERQSLPPFSMTVLRWTQIK